MALPHVHLQSLSRTADHFALWRDKDPLDLDAPYQRGAVWTDEQRRNLIKSLLMGLPIGSIITSELPFRSGGAHYRVIDGKQRILAIRAFIDGDLTVPADWFKPSEIQQSGGGHVRHSDLTDEGQRRVGNATVGELMFNGKTERWDNPDYDPDATDKWGKPVPGADPNAMPRYLSRTRTDDEILRAEAELYLLINFGGVAQTDDDRARAQEIARHVHPGP